MLEFHDDEDAVTEIGAVSEETKGEVIKADSEFPLQGYREQ